METILDSPVTAKNNFSGYAGFWLRFVASFIDGIVLIIPTWIISLIIPSENLSPTGISAEELSPLLINISLNYSTSTVLKVLYFAFMESSENRGTLGKMALGLIVTDMNGDKITFAQSLGRNIAKILSAIIFLIGYIMAAFTEKKQALHDILAGCLVVKK